MQPIGETDSPSTIQTQTQQTYNNPFGRIAPAKITPFGGERTRLVPWLIELRRWVVDLNMRNLDKLFVDYSPLIRRFLTDPIETWYARRQDLLDNYQDFQKAICNHVLGSNYEWCLVGEYRDRIQRPEEFIESYAAAKSKLVDICLIHRAREIGSIAQKVFCHHGYVNLVRSNRNTMGRGHRPPRTQIK